MLDRFYRDRRRAQAGTTLIELLVSLTVMGVALGLIVGTFGTALLDSTLTKRNTAAEAVIQYELDKISGSPFNSAPQPYSECFSTDSPTAPAPATGGGGCPDPAYSLRADVTVAPLSSTSQVWTVTVNSWPVGAQVGQPVSTYRVNR
jgi:type II secretory pathway pseudopilin PulG